MYHLSCEYPVKSLKDKLVSVTAESTKRYNLNEKDNLE